MARRLFVALAGLGERRVGRAERLWIELAAGVASCLEPVPGIVAREGVVVACGITGELIAHPRLYECDALGELARGLDGLLARLHRVEYAGSGEGAAYVPLVTFRRGGLAA